MSVTAWVIGEQVSVTRQNISPEGNSRHHSSMDDIHAIRCANLQLICKEKRGRNQSKLARKLSDARDPGESPIPANLVNRWIHGKIMGEDIARLIERAFQNDGIEYGWMDNVHPSDLAQQVALAIDREPRGMRDAIARMLNLPTPTQPPPSVAPVAAHAPPRPQIAKERRKTRKASSATPARLGS